MPKSVETLLKDYGYTEVQAGLFVPARASSERWERVEGGWHCYARATAGVTGGEPWGRVLDGGLMQVPFATKDEVELVDGSKIPLPQGVHPATAPGAFIWEWPDERLVEIYSHPSHDKDGNQLHWRRAEDGKIVKAD